IGSEAVSAPQATLMATLVEGATGGTLPWFLLILGAAIGLCCQLVGVSPLAFSIRLYLPIHNWPTIFFGGVLALRVRRKQPHDNELTEESDTGSLWAAGLIAGEAICGIVIALLTWRGLAGAVAVRSPEETPGDQLLATAIMAGVIVLFYVIAKKRKR